MKYFTKQWCFGELDDQIIEETAKNYRKHVEGIYDRCPSNLKIFVKDINLHDGIIKKIAINKTDQFLILDGVFGDLEIGYFFLRIKYVNIKNLKIDDIAPIIDGQYLCILSDEIDIDSKNIFSHRVLFSSKRELEIFFEDIEITIQHTNAKYYKEELCILEVTE